MLEPEERAWLGPEPPEDLRDYVSHVTWKDAAWLEGDGIPLNPGLVTVIGPRGSGKTAFVDLLAAASGALRGTLSQSSFLWRASTPVDRLGPAEVKLLWQDGSGDYTTLGEAVRSTGLVESTGSTCYLSQHLVERLCSADGLAIDLRREMERVVFDTTDPLDRQEAADFDGLVETLVAPLRRTREELVSWIDDLVERINLEGSLIERLPQLRKQAEDLRTDEGRLRSLIETLLPKGAEERTKALLALEEACASKEKVVETLRRQRTRARLVSFRCPHVLFLQGARVRRRLGATVPRQRTDFARLEPVPTSFCRRRRPGDRHAQSCARPAHYGSREWCRWCALD